MAAVGTLSTSIIISLVQYPLQVIKNRLALMDQLIRLGILDQRYEGFFDCIKRMISQQGYMSLYKGFWMHLIINFVASAIRNYMIFFLRKLQANRQKDGFFKWLGVNLFKSMLIGSVTLVATYTINVSQTISVNDIKKQYKNPAQIQNHIRAQRGIKGLFTGIGISLLGMGLYRVLYLIFQESLKQFLQKMIKNEGLRKFITGHLIAIGTSICCYPLELIRQRMVLACPTNQKYESVRECVEQISSENDKKVSNFWCGVGISVSRALFASVCTYALSRYLQRNK